MSEGAFPADEPRIVYVDDAIVVADKPAGMLSVPGRGPERQDCLAARVQAGYPDARTVHRLDMATSGLIVMARGVEMHRRLSGAFERRQVAKRYMAIVAGHVTADAGSIELPLVCDWENRPRQIVDHVRGRAALTHYRIIERIGTGDMRLSRVALEPVTGRSHQLRVHLLSLGHPILGDELYAPPEYVAPVTRMHLHAERLAFAHPATGAEASFTSPAPF